MYVRYIPAVIAGGPGQRPTDGWRLGIHAPADGSHTRGIPIRRERPEVEVVIPFRKWYRTGVTGAGEQGAIARPFDVDDAVSRQRLIGGDIQTWPSHGTSRWSRNWSN